MVVQERLVSCLELIEAGLRGCDLLCSGLQSPSQIPDDALAVCMEAQQFRNFPWVEIAFPSLAECRERIPIDPHGHRPSIPKHALGIDDPFFGLSVSDWQTRKAVGFSSGRRCEGE